MSLPLVVVSEPLDQDCVEWLATHATVSWLPMEDRPALLEGLAEADGLVVRTYTRVDEELLKAAPNLRVVGRGGVGLENIDVEACRRRGLQVVYTPDANTQAVLEYVFAAVLAHVRPMFWLKEAPSVAQWSDLRATVLGDRQINEMTLGILGIGRIGSRVGQVATALGMRVVGYDILPREEILHRIGWPLEFVPPARVLEEADVLTLHVDGRPGNRGMIASEELAALKPGCLLVNTARGMLVDPFALAAWARLAQLQGGGAILDVHEPEPFGPDYPLLGLPNVRLAPHLASRTQTAMRNMSWVVRDVLEVLERRPPRYPAP